MQKQLIQQIKTLKLVSKLKRLVTAFIQPRRISTF